MCSLKEGLKLMSIISKIKKKMIKKFIIVTTGRSDYGMLKKLANELEKDKKKIVIVATGTHLSRKHGYTIKEINKDKFKHILKINLNIRDDKKKYCVSNLKWNKNFITY